MIALSLYLAGQENTKKGLNGSEAVFSGNRKKDLGFKRETRGDVIKVLSNSNCSFFSIGYVSSC